MAMSKKEKLEYAKIIWDLRIHTALRFTDKVSPDIPIPEYTVSSPLTKGWVPIGSLGNQGRVEVACSSSVHHAIGRTDRTTSQNAIRLYSTKLLALRGLRNQVEKRCAEELSRIDQQIEEEELKQATEVRTDEVRSA